MRAVVQRVSQASVEIDGQIVATIGKGFVILLGVNENDVEADAEYLANKISGLRIFEDSEGKMNLDLKESGGEVLAISQFTLYADTRKGRRPSFIHAALPEKAEPLYEYFIKCLDNQGIQVKKGIFGAMMLVKIFNQGPVTIIIDSSDRMKPRRQQ
ncbi:MAG: D-aminoacyl-tRNA deacylase [Calditrichia bacterium]